MRTFLCWVMACLLVAGGISCSEKRTAATAPEGDKSSEAIKEQTKPERELDAEEGEEEEAEPGPADIVEDCIAFLRLTKAFPKDAGTNDCPGCPPPDAATEVLAARNVKVNRVTCSGENCEVEATMRAVFNQSHGGEIRGGLTGWITPEQRAEYAHGKTPAGEQVYNLKISYRHDEIGWKAIEWVQP